MLSKLIDDLDTITGGFRTRTATVATLIDALDQLSSDLGPSAKANAQALTNLATTTQILADQRTRWYPHHQPQQPVEGGAEHPRRPPRAGRQPAEALRSVTQAVADRQVDLGRLLVNLPGHNAALRLGTVDDFVQVLNDFIVCGLPNGGEDPPPRSTPAPTSLRRPNHDPTPGHREPGRVLRPERPPHRLRGVRPAARQPARWSTIDARCQRSSRTRQGLRTDFSASFNGVIVGVVKHIRLDGNGVKVTVALDHGVQIPGDVEARVIRASPVGEQRIDFVPTKGGTAPPLEDGAMVPAAPNAEPPVVADVVDTVVRLLEAIPADDLNTFVHETATALRGRSDDIRTLIDASDVFSQEFLAHEQGFRQLLASAPPVLDAARRWAHSSATRWPTPPCSPTCWPNAAATW